MRIFVICKKRKSEQSNNDLLFSDDEKNKLMKWVRLLAQTQD